MNGRDAEVKSGRGAGKEGVESVVVSVREGRRGGGGG
jgi:hypothetical protein